MKQTREDKRFATNFAKALQHFITREQSKGRSIGDIAAELGVSGPGLMKQLAGGTPSIRTVALAHALYGISVPYTGINFAKGLRNKTKKKQKPEREQLLLPFEITAPAQATGLGLKLLPRGIRTYRLQLTISTAG